MNHFKNFDISFYHYEHTTRKIMKICKYTNTILFGICVLAQGPTIIDNTETA